MISSFFEFHVAASGLFTAKSNLAVTSHNIANAATPGFSRQIALQRAAPPLPLGNGKGMIGTGSEVYGIEQIRDLFLDKKYWNGRCVLGEYNGKTSQLSMMENVFNEMEDGAGLSTALNDIFAKASDLATTANDGTYRINLVQTANTLAEMIHTQAQALRKQQLDANTELAIVVEQINSLGMQMTSLNKQIATLEADGSSANDLRDERARLTDELSEYVNVDVREMDYTAQNGRNDKRYAVLINGYDFVNHHNVNPLMVEERLAPANVMDAAGLYDVRFSGSKAPFNLYHPKLTGQIKGLVDIRDGNGSAGAAGSQVTVGYKGIPYYLDKLNLLVRTLARAIDMGEYSDTAHTRLQDVTGHVYGYNLANQRPGTLFFTYAGGPETLSIIPGAPGFPDRADDTGFYESMNCLNFMVNESLKTDPSLVNCSSDGTLGESAYGVTRSFSLINENGSLFKEGKLLDYVAGMSSEMGIDAAQAANFAANYKDVITGVDNQRISVSGVDLNEEMILMIKNQQIYQAAAKLVNTVNGIYDYLINRMGA